jgi:uncharacterized protein YjdB
MVRNVLAGCAALALALGCGGSSNDGTGSIGTADGGAVDGGVGAADGGAADAGGPYGNLTSISLSQTDVHIPVGTMTAFAVTGTYSDGTRADLTQQAQATSNNTSVATVAHGQGSQIQITAVGEGTATVTVTVGSLSQNCAVTVTR